MIESFFCCAWPAYDLLLFAFSSDEAKPVVQDNSYEVASGLMSAYDRGELKP
jgi:hypothetical protein